MKFNEGELILCYHGPLLYEAKILKTFLLQNEERYFIHYSGWNKNWDEWVGENRILKINPENIQKQKELKSSLATKCRTKKEKQALHFSKLRGHKGEEDGGPEPSLSPEGSRGGPGESFGSTSSPEKSTGSEVRTRSPDQVFFRTPQQMPSSVGRPKSTLYGGSAKGFGAGSLGKKKSFKVSSASSRLTFNKKAHKLPHSGTSVGDNDSGNMDPGSGRGVGGMIRKRMMKPPNPKIPNSSLGGSGDGFDSLYDTTKPIDGDPSELEDYGITQQEMDYMPDLTSPSLPNTPSFLTHHDADGGRHPSPNDKDHPNDLSQIRIHVPDTFKPFLLDDWDYVTRQQMLVLLPSVKTIETIFEEYLLSRKALDWSPAKMYLAEEFVIAIKKYFDSTIGSQLLYSFERPQYADVLEEQAGKSMCQVYGGVHLLRLFVNLFENLTQFQLSEQQVTFLVTYIKDFFTHFNKNLADYIKEGHYESAAPEYYRKII